MDSPILIVSPPRSGSSLMGMILEKSGVFSGETKPGDKFNPKGYYENIKITKLIVDYLRLNDFDKGKKFQPINLGAQYYGDFKAQVESALRQDGYIQGDWFYKDPKIALTWRLWHKTFPSAKWLILERDTHSTISSIMRSDFMDAYKSYDEWHDYLNRFKANIESIKHNCEYHLFDTNSLFTGDNLEIQKMYDFITVKNQGKHLECIDKSLFNAS